MKIVHLLVLFAIISCKKDVAVQLPDEPAQPYISGEYALKPCSLLTGPGSGWQDSATHSDIDRFFFNPSTRLEIFYLKAGELFVYYTPTKTRKKIAQNVTGIPDINQHNCIVYCQTGQGLYKIKTHGDSLQFLNHYSENPKWDHTGNFILFTKGNYVLKTDKIGNIVDTILHHLGLLACFKNSSRMIGLRPDTKDLFTKDLVSGSETTLLHGTNADYAECTIENKDEFCYWLNKDGLIQLNLSTLKADTLIKSCAEWDSGKANFVLSSLHIPKNFNRLTFVEKRFIPSTGSKRTIETHALQMEVSGGKTTEIKLFD